MIPRMLLSDAYTISGPVLESHEANERSTYYGTFRKFPEELKRWRSSPNDNRILFAGLPYLIEKYLSTPITHDELDETKKFLILF